MIPEYFIEKSIKGGFPRERAQAYLSYNDERVIVALFATDPLYWSCLGKALGWDDGCFEMGTSLKNGIYTPDTRTCRTEAHVNAHRFYDLILTNSDTAKFWEELKTKE